MDDFPFRGLQKVAGSPGQRHGCGFRYGLCLLAVGLSFLLRESLTPLIVDQDPFMFFAPAVVFSAYVGGIPEGAMAWLAGLLLGDYMFTGQRFSFGPFGPAQITLMSTYTFTSFTAIFLIRALHRLKMKAENYSHALEEEVKRRTEAEAQLQRAQQALQKHADTLEIAVSQRTKDLEETVEHLEGVLYHLAHDLRSPLRAMAGYSALMQKHYQPKPGWGGEDWAERITNAAGRMDSLIQDLLAYGKLGHARFPGELLQLEEPIARVLRELHSQILESRAEIRVDKPLIKVWGNQEGLYQVFIQLLSNALKFKRPGFRPEIRIWTEAVGNQTRVWVEDKGIGIEPQHTERVFRVFEQLRSGEFEGHGMGLAIVRAIVSRMEGQVGVISKPNEGSRFWLLLNTSEANATPSRENHGQTLARLESWG